MAEKILLVDDALFQRTLCREILAEKNFEISEAADGEEALKKIAEWKPDLVLLDITLPGKNGLEILADIRKISRTLKVIMVTAQGQKAFMMEALEMGASDYVLKPFNPDKLMAAVLKALGKGSR